MQINGRSCDLIIIGQLQVNSCARSEQAVTTHRVVGQKRMCQRENLESQERRISELSVGRWVEFGNVVIGTEKTLYSRLVIYFYAFLLLANKHSFCISFICSMWVKWPCYLNLSMNPNGQELCVSYVFFCRPPQPSIKQHHLHDCRGTWSGCVEVYALMEMSLWIHCTIIGVLEKLPRS